ncbi:MAG: T9SS type A sorting domain-containing protein [Bacteroidales bacterium]
MPPRIPCGAIEGETAEDRFGSSTSISDDGSIVAIGARSNDGNGINAGHVRIFENPTVNIEAPQQKEFSLYPNPTNGILHVEVENGSAAFNKDKVQKLTVCDITGKQLLAKTRVQPPETIDISGLESGIYIISVQTGDKVFTRKIIKE